MRILMILIAVILLGSILGIIHKVKQEQAQPTVSDSSWDITDKKYVNPRPELDVELLPVNEYSRPGLALKKVRGIVVHYTANPGTTIPRTFLSASPGREYSLTGSSLSV